MKARFLWLATGLLVASHGSVSAAGSDAQHPEFTGFQGNRGYHQDQSQRPIKITEFTTCSVSRTGNQLSITLPSPYGTHTIQSDTLQHWERDDPANPGNKKEGHYLLYFVPPEKSGANLGHMLNFKKGKKGGLEHRGVIHVKSASVVTKVDGKVAVIGCELRKK